MINTGTDEEKAAAIEALNNANGWRMNLEYAGEKNLAKTLTINGKIFMTTFTPSNLLSDINVCEPQAGTGLMYILDLYDGSRNTINLGGIIPDTPSLHFADDGQIRVLLPPGWWLSERGCFCPPPFGNWFETKKSGPRRVG